jgi:predicted esterase
VAGFSGGGKRAGTVAPLLARAGLRLNGIFLTGINEERLTTGYRQFRPGVKFLQTPVFISSGRDDQVAPLAEQSAIKQKLEQAGFTRVRQEIFPNKHVVKRSHVREALRWFRSGR